MSEKEVVIVNAKRTPFGRFGGAMKDIPSVELGAKVLKEVLNTASVEPSLVEEVYYGTCVLAENALNQNVIGRQAVLKAGLPPQTISLTIDRACCSSLTAVQHCYRNILSGEVSVAVAVGSENMSRVPYLLDGARWGKRLGHLQLEDNLHEMGYSEWNPVAVDAGEVAVEEGVSRKEQDEWAVESHQKYAKAAEQGKFNEEIIPIEVKDHKGRITEINEDEQPRPDTTLEKLEKLPTVYGSPTVTPGNAPGLNTGASAVLLMSRSKAEELRLEPLGKIKSISSVALEPNYIAKVPAPALSKAVEKAGLSLADIDLIEINEAFAAMPLVATKLLSQNNETLMNELREKTNVNGGAVAIGHPVGASGARILMTMMYELRRKGGGKGALAICGGLAQGDGAVIEV